MCVWQATQSCMWLAPLSILTTLMCFLLSFVASCWLFVCFSLRCLPCPPKRFFHFSHYVIIIVVVVTECSSGVLLRHLQHSFTWQYFLKIATAFGAAAIITATAIMKRKHTGACTLLWFSYSDANFAERKIMSKSATHLWEYSDFAYFLIVVVFVLFLLMCMITRAKVKST